MEFTTISFLIVSFFALNTLITNASPINDDHDTIQILTTTPPIESNSKSIEFNFTLPTHQILKVNISFLMLKESKPLETRDNAYLLNDDEYKDEDSTTTTTTTTTTAPPSVTTEDSLLDYFTVDDAIEAFRKDLIKQEINIGGILDSDHSFYRHFNLKYENVNIPIRCTYDSVFEKQKLKISCFEYREFEQERILSNGEIEKVRTPDLTPKLQDIRITHLKNYTQTYKMSIE